jgi:hypothetical protein
MVKYVIHTLTIKASNRSSDHFWGLGDIIRGTIKLYQLSKKYNFKLIVDKQHHPLSNYLINNEHQFSQIIKSYRNNIPIVGEPENYILNSTKKSIDVLIFFTNDKFNDPITEDCKDFIKHNFTPNTDFLNYIIEKTNTIPFKEYTILHYRLGDDELVKNIKNKKLNNNSFVDHINKNKTKYENYILVSDSLNLKKIVRGSTDIFMFDSIVAHMGCSTDLKDTLFEFFIITNAKKIKTYSVYPWTSGFVKIANDIFDVPLEKME